MWMFCQEADSTVHISCTELVLLWYGKVNAWQVKKEIIWTNYKHWDYHAVKNTRTCGTPCTSVQIASLQPCTWRVTFAGMQYHVVQHYILESASAHSQRRDNLKSKVNLVLNEYFIRGMPGHSFCITSRCGITIFNHLECNVGGPR
jgi:hypothetical protein